MSEFERKTIAEWQAAGIIRVEDGNHGENRPRKHEFCEQGMAFIRAADMRDGSVIFDGAEKIDEVAEARVRKGIGKPNDILISHKGTVGRVARAPNDAPPFVCSPQTTFWRVLNEDRVDRNYLFALMRSYKFQSEFAVRAGETDMAGYVSLTSQRDLELELPPIGTQRAIGRIIGALDDKIELNRRMSWTLEEMARALYRSWFVDFDPVHAGAAGQPPAHMDAPTAALFPDSFGPDGLPEGWRREPLLRHISASRGLSYKGKHLCGPGEGVPLHNLNSIYEGGGYKEAGAKFYNGDFKQRHEIRPGDLIVANTEQSFGLALIGHAALVPSWLGPFGLFSQHLYKVEPKEGSPLSNEWLYLALSVAPLGVEIRGFSNGTTVNMLPADAFEIPEAIIPTAEIVEKMNEFVRPAFKRQERLRDESRTLAALRDALLPRLMSGELRVHEAEKQIGEVV